MVAVLTGWVWGGVDVGMGWAFPGGPHVWRVTIATLSQVLGKYQDN